MFRQIMRYIMTITSVMVIGLWALFFIKQYNDQITQREYSVTNSYTQIGNPVLAENTKEYYQVIRSFQKTSQQVKIPFIKRTFFQGHVIKNGKVDYGRFLDTVTIEASSLNDSPLERKFMRHLRNGQVFTTQKIRQTVRLKKYSAVNFTIQNIKYHGIPETREGYYFIQTKNAQKIEKFKKQLQINFSKEFGRKFSSNSFSPPELVDKIPIDASAEETFAQTFSIFQLALLIIFVLTLSYDIGVYRLLGESRVEILKQIMLAPLMVGGALAGVISLVGAVSTSSLQVGIMIVAVSAVWLLGQLGLAFVVISVMLLFPTQRILVRQNFAKKLFIGLYLGKGLLFMTLLTLVLPLATLSVQFVKTKILIQETANQSFKNYGAFFPTSIGYNQDSLIDPSVSARIDDQIIYPVVNQKGGLLIDTSAIKQPINAQYKAVDVNPNYLKFNPIRDLHSKKVLVSEQIKTPLVLLPINNRSLEPAIKHYYSNDLKTGVPKFILVKENQSIKDSHGKRITDYVYLNVVTQKNKARYLDILTGDDSDPLKVMMGQHSSRDVYQQYRKMLQQNNLTDNYPQLVRVSVLPFEYLQQAQGNVFADVALIGTSLLLFFILIVASIYTYFIVYGRDFAIMSTLGLSLFRSGRLIWVLWSGQFLIATLFVLISSGNQLELTLLTSISGAILDGVITLIAVRVFSQSHLRRLTNE